MSHDHEHGHEHGDRLLKQVASLLDDQARDTDVVTRSGGEEFIVVLSGTELAGATMFAERMRSTVAKSTLLTVSSGVATVGEKDDVKTFLMRADTALYAAKAAGRNTVFCHNGQDAYPAASQDLSAPMPGRLSTAIHPAAAPAANDSQAVT